MAEEPDPDHMIRFCREILPGMLTEACGVTEAEAAHAADDILSRAEAAARRDLDSRRLLAAALFEESFWHDPDDAPPWMKAFTTLVVRNSYLEELQAARSPTPGMVPGAAMVHAIDVACRAVAVAEGWSAVQCDA